MKNIFTVGYYRAHEHVIHITAAILVAVICIWIAWIVFIPTQVMGTSQRIHVATGKSLSTISKTLKERGLIRSSLVFRFYVSALGWDRNLQAGDYTIPAGGTLHSIASQIAGGKGASTDISVFIPEGSNIWEIDKRLANAGLITEGQFARAYASREGYLFPDTYRFKPNSLIGEMEQKMEQNGQDKTKELVGDLGSLARSRIIIIASIIEKEARDQSDMHLVSGVIANRLKRKMNLEIDATVSYGACTRIFSAKPTDDCEVQQIGVGKEIRIDSPYNSYMRAGLPAGPISNPGLTSIQAALNPKGDYLFYLSSRDGSQTIFSHTGDEHAINRRKYLGL